MRGSRRRSTTLVTRFGSIRATSLPGPARGNVGITPISDDREPMPRDVMTPADLLGRIQLLNIACTADVLGGVPFSQFAKNCS